MSKTRHRYAKDLSGKSFSVIARQNFTIMGHIQTDELAEYRAARKGKKAGRQEGKQLLKPDRLNAFRFFSLESYIYIYKRLKNR